MHQRFAAEMQGVVLKAETAVMSALSAQMESDQVTDEDQKNLGVWKKGGPFGWLMFLQRDDGPYSTISWGWNYIFDKPL